MDHILHPLQKLRHDGGASDIRIWARVSIEAMERACMYEENLPELGPESGPESGPAHYGVWEGDAGAELASFFKELSTVKAGLLSLKSQDWVGTLRAMLAQHMYRRKGRTHPRLFIWGPLEARLQHADIMVLGALNEGSWPQKTVTDPFLSRTMKNSISLEPAERRIGQSAHDFQQFFGKKRLIISRSEREDRAPAVPSRWLQRLITMIGPSGTHQMRVRGHKYLHWALEMDTSGPVCYRSDRPNPKPPVAARPTRLSFTDIEVWLRDPYALYAKKILGLRPLPRLVIVPDASLRGSLYHDILAEFIAKNRATNASEQAYLHLLEIAREKFEILDLGKDIHALWWPRFCTIADHFIAWEMERQGNVQDSYCEIEGQLKIQGTSFQLTGRADRIDRMKDHSLVIMDYKTGKSPSKKQARTLSPQLALEGAVALHGGFNGLKSGKLSQLLYVRLQTGERLKVDDISYSGSKIVIPATELANKAWDQLIHLVETYQNPDQGYPSRIRVLEAQKIDGDYDHLARVMEWNSGTHRDGE